jgi:hypothetical protein
MDNFFRCWAGSVLVLCLAASLAADERGSLGYIPGGYRRAAFQQATYPCPCERPAPAPDQTPAAPPDEGNADEIPDPGRETDAPPDDFSPEVADLSSDAAMASASQSAAPNMIGDTIGYGGTGYITLGFTTIPFSPGGGRKFKASTNQSPVPEQRFFYNFHWFEDALAVQGPGTPIEFIDVTRHEFCWEWPIWNGLASAQIQLPLSNSIDSTITEYDLTMGGFGAPAFTDAEIGNIALALKGLLYETDCDALSLGLAVDLPTAEDVVISDAGGMVGTLHVESEAVTLSPFVGYVYQSPCRWFAQGFLQLAVALNENDYRLDTPAGDTVGDIDEETLFFGDVGVGFWFYHSDYDGMGCGGQTGCGSYGVAGIVELHYSTSLDDNTNVPIDDFNPLNRFEYSNFEWVNLTLGFAAHYDCWTLTPAVVVPGRDAPDRQFDVEWTVQLNRHY